MHPTFRLAPRRQNGDTLTGLIIGLIIGLAIAVAVALAITKGATPFTDRGKPGKPAEPTAGQASDPNKPLYGNKDAAREANRQLADKQKAADADLPAPAGDAGAPAQHDMARPAVPKAEAAGDDKVVYFLQAGAFREVSDAENTRARLALLGFESTISDRVGDAGVLHRVRIGPYSQAEAVNKARAKLIDSGIDAAIVRSQK